MDEKIKGLLHLGFAIIVVVLVLLFSQDIGRLKEWGYAGVFLISMLSAATLFIPAPGWAIVIAMGRVLDVRLVGLAAGIGSALGEITGYAAGQGASELVHANAHFQRYKEWIQKNDMAAIAVLAFIPNPLFDIAGIAAGALKMPLWRYVLATAIGRTIRFILLAQMGAFSLQYI